MFEIVSFFLHAPFDKILAEFDLESFGVGDFGDIIYKAFGDFGHSGFGEDVEMFGETE